MGSVAPKEKKKQNKEKGLVNEGCILEDSTGHAILHILEKMIQKCNSLKSYEFTNLCVKNYSGHGHLGTTATTTIKEIDLKIDNLKGPDLLQESQKSITVNGLFFTDKVNIVWTCQNKCSTRKCHMLWDMSSMWYLPEGNIGKKRSLGKHFC